MNYLQYNNIRGPSLSQLRAHANYPDQPDYLSVYPSFSTRPTVLRQVKHYCHNSIAK